LIFLAQAVFCVHGNEHLGYTREREFVEFWEIVRVWRKPLFHAVS
jgi:hypothetical protein